MLVKILLPLGIVLIAGIMGTLLTGMTEEVPEDPIEAIEYFDIELYAIGDAATYIKPSPYLTLEEGQVESVYYLVTNNFVSFKKVGVKNTGSVGNKINVESFAREGSGSPPYCAPLPLISFKC